MSRTVSATITNAERDPVADWTHEITVRREFWSFSSFAVNTNTGLDIAVPQSFVMRATGPLAYAASRHTDGTARVRVIDTTVGADYTLANTHAVVAGQCMRPGLVRLANGECWLYSAIHNGSGVQVQRVQLTGTSNNLSFSLANFGPVFGPAYQANSTRVRRVEAVCPTDNGVIVAVGIHDFALGLSTIRFWWIDTGGSAYQLNALIQMPLAGDYTTFGGNWYAGAKYCSNISATYISSTKQILVVANDQVRGRAVMFTVQNGIDSMVRPVVEIDPEAGLLSLMPYSITQINGLIYLTARFSRYARLGKSTTQTLGIDVALISSNGRHFSFGERTWFLSDLALGGTILMRTDSPSTLYYGGNAMAASSTVTEIQAPSSGQSSDLTPYLADWGVSRVAKAADSMSVALYDEAVAGGVSAHDANTHLIDGACLRIRTGMRGVMTDFGWYLIDETNAPVDPVSGRGDRTISGIDKSSADLTQQKSLIDIDLRGRMVFESGLTKLEDLDVKTPIYGDDGEEDVRATAAGLVYRALNTPFFAFCGDAEDSGDVFMQATVQMVGSDQYKISSIGFIFGANEDGGGNVMLAPAYNQWTGYTAPAAEVRGLKLNPIDEDAPDAEDTGWNLADGVNGLWKALLSGSVRTSALSGTYQSQPSFYLAPNTTYDLVFRASGRRAQLFYKVRDYSIGGAANNATYALACEFLFDEAAKRSQAGRDLVGLAISTDVAGSRLWFEQGAVGDVNVQLTDAANSAEVAAGFTRLLGTGIRQHDNGLQISGVSNISCFQVGMQVRTSSPAGEPLVNIVSISGGNIVTDYNHGPWDNAGTLVYNYTISIYGLPVSDEWGWADSSATRETQDGGSKIITTDPGAAKLKVPAGGRALFIANTNTAAVTRIAKSDGQKHKLRSGSAGATGTYRGWDATNPLASTKPLNSGSRPSDWRIVLAGGLIFEGAASSVGIPDGVSTPRYMKVGRERIRYMQVTYSKQGVYPCDAPNNNTSIICPAYYAPLPAHAAGATEIRQWRSGVNQPGDDLGLIPNVVGLQAKILNSSNSRGADGKARYYVVDNNYVASPTDSVTSSVFLDKPYPNEIQGAQTSISPVKASDILVLTGRGAFGDEEERHDEDAPMNYCPCDGLTGVVDGVLVSYLQAYSGLVRTSEDAIRRLLALAGNRYGEFRNYHTDPKTDASITLTTTPQALPTLTNVADFTLDASVHIPGNSTNGSGVTGEKRLLIYFRGYYGLAITQLASANDYQFGKVGKISVGLFTTSTDINAPSSGDVRWLERSAPVPVTDYNIAGSVSGTTPNFTLTEDLTKLVDLRVMVRGNMVVVEVAGQHVWTFNLDRFATDTTTYRRDTAGPITVAYSVSPGSYTSVWRVLELGDEITSRYTLREGASPAQGISEITGNRHISWVATPQGGTRFSKFWTRDSIAAITENLLGDDSKRDGQVKSGHYRVVGGGRQIGGASGEYVDLAHVRARGWTSNSSENDILETPEAARLEAQLLSREAAEFSQPREFNGGAYIEADPEDVFPFYYNMGGDAPAQASINLIMTDFSFKTGDNLRSLMGRYNARLSA